jgi:cysteinyl-tRNA synthetase
VLDPADWESGGATPEGPSDEDVARWVEERRLARENRDWARADEMRDRLAVAGIVLEDTPQGTRWKRQ